MVTSILPETKMQQQTQVQSIKITSKLVECKKVSNEYEYRMSSSL